MIKRSFWVLLPFFAFGTSLGPPLFAETLEPLQLEYHEKDGHFDLKTQFQVAADKKTVWNVLTDLGSYPKLSPELKKVEVVKRTPRRMTVEETAEGGFLFITQKVFFTLDIRLDPGRSIVGEDVGHKSFVSYRYRWDLKELKDGKGVELRYHLEAVGHFDGPAFMVSDHFRGGVQHFLEELRKEILRRKALPP